MGFNKSKISIRQIVAAQLFAIILWVLITVIQWATNPKGSPGLLIPLIVRTIEAIAILFVAALFIIGLERSSKDVRVARIRFLLLGLMYVGALAANLLSLGMRGLIGFAPPKIEGYFFIQSLHFYIPLYILLVVYAMIKNRLEAIYERENKLKAEGLAQQAKWMMLRYQVNPHFLFNALNTIRAMVGVHDEKARKVITDMSQYFRYSLSSEEKEIVTVDDEIAAVKNYLEIQKARFHDKLKIFIDISETSKFVLIPIFTLQMLVENAMKYGLKTTEGVLKIYIESEFSDNTLILIVKNSGHIIYEQEKVNGTEKGIENFKKRLEYIYPDHNDFTLEERDGDRKSVV